MNKPALRIIVLLAFTLSCNSPVLAVKTNVNEVNDLFDRHIENKDGLMRDLQEQREGAVRDIETGKGLQHIEGINEAEGKARELESIREVDLESSGRQKRASEEYRFYDDNELEPDYSKPGNLAHKRDADEIVSQTGLSMKKLGKDLQTKLSALGIDCRQSKGATQKDLTYHIEIKGEEHRNSEYEQVFCEEPRNTYNCNDTATLRCARRGKRWNPWQYREIDIGGYEIYHQANHLGYSIKWKRKRHGWHLVLDSAGWRAYLSQRLNIPLEQIHEQIHFPAGARGVGGANNPVGERWRIVFDAYRFGYNYRDGYEVCEEWSEDWNERCYIK